MKTSVILPLALWATSGALAWQDPKHGECKWHGTAPFCGGSPRSVGDKDQATGEKLIITTERLTRVQACRKIGWPWEIEGNLCADDYGYFGCITGYKRLWCEM